MVTYLSFKTFRRNDTTTNARIRGKFVMDIKNFENIIELLDNEDEMFTLLEKFDSIENDDFKSKYIGKIVYQENIYTFFIREFKRMKNQKLDETIYNTICEWIILRIPRGEEALGVGYQSRIDIKKFIPTVLGMDLETIGDIEIIKEYEEFNDVSTVLKFFQEIEDNEQIPLVEILIELSPIRSNPSLKINSQVNNSIGPSLKWFREQEKDLITDINSITECKIHYEKHRIRLVFTQEEEQGILIRYGDNNLPLSLRNSLEDYMQKDFNLVVIPGIHH